jgi:nucleotide-binding universal stress UspA family protein
MLDRILIATDGHHPSLGALRVGAALVRELGSRADVVSVLEPSPPFASGGADLGGEAWGRVTAAASAALRDRVREQLEILGGALSERELRVVIGPPAATIVRLAQEISARLIVVGLGRHGIADRWFGTEMALRVMRLAHVPVLAVPPEGASRPARGVVAMDFTDYSRDAARVAAALLRPGGELHLVHVLWDAQPALHRSGRSEWLREYRALVTERLSHEVGRAAESGGVQVRPHMALGDPAREILRLADEIDADLIAAGSHGAGFVGRVLMGSVSTRLVRGARSAVLVAPPRSVPPELAGMRLEPRPADEPADEAGTLLRLRGGPG